MLHLAPAKERGSQGIPSAPLLPKTGTLLRRHTALQPAPQLEHSAGPTARARRRKEPLCGPHRGLLSLAKKSRCVKSTAIKLFLDGHKRWTGIYHARRPESIAAVRTAGPPSHMPRDRRCTHLTVSLVPAHHYFAVGPPD